MPTIHIPDKLLVRIVRLGEDDYKQFVRDAVEEKLKREEKKVGDR